MSDQSNNHEQLQKFREFLFIFSKENISNSLIDFGINTFQTILGCVNKITLKF